MSITYLDLTFKIGYMCVVVKQRRNSDAHMSKWIAFSSLLDRFRVNSKQNYLVVEPSQRHLLHMFLAKKL